MNKMKENVKPCVVYPTQEEVKKIDQAAKKNRRTRSDFMIIAALQRAEEISEKVQAQEDCFQSLKKPTS